MWLQHFRDNTVLHLIDLRLKERPKLILFQLFQDSFYSSRVLAPPVACGVASAPAAAPRLALARLKCMLSISLSRASLIPHLSHSRRPSAGLTGAHRSSTGQHRSAACVACRRSAPACQKNTAPKMKEEERAGAGNKNAEIYIIKNVSFWLPPAHASAVTRHARHTTHDCTPPDGTTAKQQRNRRPAGRTACITHGHDSACTLRHANLHLRVCVLYARARASSAHESRNAANLDRL
jgi:hypothetical protein